MHDIQTICRAYPQLCFIGCANYIYAWRSAFYAEFHSLPLHEFSKLNDFLWWKNVFCKTIYVKKLSAGRFSQNLPAGTPMLACRQEDFFRNQRESIYFCISFIFEKESSCMNSNSCPPDHFIFMFPGSFLFVYNL